MREEGISVLLDASVMLSKNIRTDGTVRIRETESALHTK